MMNLGFTTCNYSWQKSISIILTALEFFTDIVFGLICVLRWAFSALTLRKLFCSHVFDDGHNRRFSNPCSGAQFTCVAMVVPNQRIDFFWGLHCRCNGWYAAAGPNTNFLFTSLKTTGPASELTFMESSPYTFLRRLLISIGLEPCAVRK